MKLATAQDMRKIDERAVRDYSLTISRLMESAGRAAAQVLVKKFGPVRGRRIGVLCGKGHNGGDGLVLARLLHQKKARLTVVLAGDEKELSVETRKQFQKVRRLKIPVLIFGKSAGLKSIQTALAQGDFIVDALLGTGLSRPVEGSYLRLIQMAGGLKKPILAVDIPSGLSADSGAPLGAALPADLTITFGLSKIGFYTPIGSNFIGELHTVNIGFPEKLLNAEWIRQELVEWEQVRKMLPRYDPNTHKGIRGRVLIAAGSTGLTGAAALSAWGAQRIGSGLVTVACPKSLNAILEVKLTEPMTLPVPEVKGGFLSTKAAPLILRWASNMNAVVIGPGIGRHPETGRLIRSLLPRLTVPMVVDADALHLLGGHLEILKKVKVPVVLTPHPGEAAALLRMTTAGVERNRVKVAKQIAQGYNVTVVLKGRYTVIAGADGRVRVNPTGNRGLATGGTGDVLSGMVGGLLAQRLPAFDATTAGVYLHGLAGEMAGRELGQDGLLAGDLLPQIPRLLRQLKESRQEPYGRRR